MSTINSQILTGNKFDAPIRSNLEFSRTGASVNGNYRGETVRAHNATQSLFDAMEELTALGSEKAEKDLTKRKVKDGSIRVNEAHELVSDYLRKVPDLEKNQKIKDLATKMASGNLSTIAQLQAYLNGFSEEKSHQYLALQAVKKFLGTNPESKSLLALIDQAILTFEQNLDSWAQINTEIRVSSFADEYSQEQGFSSLHQLRGFYRDTVHSYQGLSSAYKDVVERFGAKEVSTAVEFMLQGMSADLSVQGSSIDSVKLQLLMSDMQKLKTLNTLQDQVSNLYQIFKPQQANYGLSSY
ncbi:type III secretion system gatekeeper subunit SctW (plasmid) [Photobacterium damselae subsp. piscicida]|uniref:Putative TTSS outer membrane protein N n=1 Tax=Photobacterium damsela subsp. piscicida TaxID=38294 RepID=Q66PU3_PHODP|nr:type III secretion system gatekeeper subunit SctW [Photobacterium damselae]AAU11473.1 putative TTSS outer membrane protein N [Photobacterium damselae subsp. piscicida]MBE8130542.1 type III secretion system gatekeeper subunit SctW [Photobacterium damselae subsp. piscicida]MBE8130573.1 type III secretion system gatekeeper subunit SctW [Photobacterium damselae subsp. piscicida]MDP2516822.1 type III secretion system gatekeeper subunit SctW [Photobacterium damselae subsp. piscicida]MDP2545924.1 